MGARSRVPHPNVAPFATLGWGFCSFRHYAFDQPGPVLVNEPQKAELRVSKVS